MGEASMITARGLCASYGSRQVLDHVDLTVSRGSVCALLGPNGAGKTTVVRVLSTLVRADSGTATVAGHDVRLAPEEVRRSISLTGQYAAVDGLLTGAENLLLMARLGHLGRSRARSRTAEQLERFDLVDVAHRRVATYSGGMRRRLDLAVSLLTRPAVLFLDEPTTGLDPRSRQTMWDVVRGLVADGTTILLTTQYLEEADQLADTVVLLDRGKVIADGTPVGLKRRLAVERLELLFVDAAGAARAGDALVDLAPELDAMRHTVTVATDGTADAVREILARLQAYDIAVRTIALKQPSLDDVFLTLTAR